MATTSGTIQAKETRLKRTAEYGLKCLYSDLKKAPLLYIQNFNQKLTCILNKLNKIKRQKGKII